MARLIPVLLILPLIWTVFQPLVKQWVDRRIERDRREKRRPKRDDADDSSAD